MATTTHHELAQETSSPLFTLAAKIGWTSDLVTRSGFGFHVRPAQSDDEERLARFFRTLPPEDLRHRFLTLLREVADDLLRQMARNDDPHTMNFLATDRETGDIFATAMLVATKDYQEAEFALATGPDAKDKGVSWTLLNHLLDYARAAGIKLVRSIETSDDARALQLEREMGFTTSLCPDDATLMIAEKRLAS